MTASDLPCLAAAWTRHETEIRRWLAARGPDPADADDLLQETFLRALRQEKRFCAIANPRAWLFEVARHLLIDRHRKTGDTIDLPDDLPAPPPEDPRRWTVSPPACRACWANSPPATARRSASATWTE